MKEGFIHVCFVIDESGSMFGSENDVCGGFNKVIEEQKTVDKGSCSVSVYRFESHVTKEFVGRDVNEIGKMISVQDRRWVNTSVKDEKETEVGPNDLTYSPCGGTAMNDGIGQAITEIGEWLSAMPEEERPEKNLIVIMTDGGENSSRKYTIKEVKDMIKHQADVYSWSFVYMGTDITDSSYANEIMGGVDGCAMSYSDRGNVANNYLMVNQLTSNYRNMEGVDYEVKNCAFVQNLVSATDEITTKYEKKVGKKIK